ncbi:hypothetical protein ACO1O0_001965 [Amphichorda felina]
MLPCTTKLADLTWKPKGTTILSGDPSSVYDEGSPHVDPVVFELGVPILGVCYGCQEIAWQTNSTNVVWGTAREYGYADVAIYRRPTLRLSGDFIEHEIVLIRTLVGDKAQVIGAVFGGVDSTVAAKLMKEAIGDRLHAILVDNGLMRLNEGKQIKGTLQKHLGINLTVVDGVKLFLWLP